MATKIVDRPSERGLIYLSLSIYAFSLGLMALEAAGLKRWHHGKKQVEKLS